MSRKLSFKEYLDSKEKLREAVRNIPHRTAKYSVRKYCKLPIGESKEDEIFVNLKPKQTVLVEWVYDDPTNPSIANIKFENVKDFECDEEHQTFWEGVKLQKWLLRNTREQK